MGYINANYKNLKFRKKIIFYNAKKYKFNPIFIY